MRDIFHFFSYLHLQLQCFDENIIKPHDNIKHFIYFFLSISKDVLKWTISHNSSWLYWIKQGVLKRKTAGVISGHLIGLRRWHHYSSEETKVPIGLRGVAGPCRLAPTLPCGKRNQLLRSLSHSTQGLCHSSSAVP